jgi:alginate O-acetyltransferase complex protein AlgI
VILLSGWFISIVIFLVLVRVWVQPAALRALAFFAASVVFIGLVAGGFAAAWPVFAFTTIAYVAVAVARTGRAALAGSIATLVIVFVALKTNPALGALIYLPTASVTVGLSYILFRSIHVMIDYHDHAIESRPAPVTFAGYALSLLTLLSGPIQRYEDFRQSPFFANRQPPAWDDVGAAIVRTTRGVFKVLVISALFSAAQSRCLVALDSADATTSQIVYLTAAALAFVGYLYANFSGYIDIVIGFGQVAGFQLPENFNDPFRATNIQDFWGRWHITLSDWVRVYVFNPMLRWSTTSMPSRRGSNMAGLVSVFTAFFIIGAWHSQNTIGLVYGMALGVGAVAHRIYGLVLKALFGKGVFKRLSESFIYVRLSQGLTLAFFALSVICLWPDRATLIQMSAGRMVGLLVAAFTVLTCVAGVCFAVDALFHGLLQQLRKHNAFVRDYRVQTIFTTAQLTVVVFVRIVMAIPAPGFVYQAY